MKTLLFAGLAGALAMVPGTAFAAIDSVPEIAPTSQNIVPFASPAMLDAAVQAGKRSGSRMGGRRMGGKRMGGMRRMGGMKKMGGQRMKRMGGHRMKKFGGNRRVHARRGGGTRFRNGNRARMGRLGHRRGYKRPHRGFRLPQSFIHPSFFIGNFGHFGLSQPSIGYGWSRYYDDAVLTDRRGVVHDARYNVDWDRYNQGYHEGYHAGQASYDSGVLLGGDRVIASPSGYNSGATTYQGDWDGAFREDGSYQGEWQGTYRDADGQVYEGQYSGTFIGDGNAAPVGTEHADGGAHWQADDRRGYRDERSEEFAYLERCKKSSGIGGALIGGAAGALIGDGIAGNRNELAGALIGGGVGAIAGAAVERSADRCRKLQRKYGEQRQHAGVRRHHHRAPVQHQQVRQGHHHAHSHAQRAYPSGWQGGYYYPQPQVTTIVIQSQPVTTTTTTTYVEEEVVYTKPKKRWKPAPKRKWKPRAKPAPVLKGCQQERCYYD